MRKLGAMAIVAVGLFALLQSLTAMSMLEFTVLELTESGPEVSFLKAGALLYLFQLLTLLAFGLFLIFKRHWIADRLFDDTNLDISLDAAPLLRLGLLLIGTFLIVQGIPVLLGVLASLINQRIYAQSIQKDIGIPVSLDRFAGIKDLVNPTVKILLGYLLIDFSKPLAARLLKDRNHAETENKDLPKCAACGASYDPADYAGGIASPRCSECGKPLDLQAPDSQ